MINKLKWHFTRILFFIINIWDFKFDFPIPPKHPLRMFQPSFWSTMFHIYRVRKLDSKSFNHDVKTLWSKKKLFQTSLESWLLKTFR